MRILLCYPPLRRSNSAKALRRLDDEDNTCVPIGLLSLGAVLREKGHEVALENFALTPWDEMLARIEAHAPGLVGISCYTFHRHIVTSLAEAVRERLPRTKIIVGGVHPTFMPEMMLERCAAVDFVAVGEAEASLPELVARLEADADPEDILGIAHRAEDGTPRFAGPAEPIEDLDSLPIAAEHWPSHIIATARGCPMQCTFCSSPRLWGRRVRRRSPEHVVCELEILRRRHGLRQVAFKDETFTLNREHVAAVCQAMIDADLDLWWTCDTRADCLCEERLAWMRRAGCFEISLGVESGSPRMLEFHGKRIDPEKVVEATLLARRFGMLVRHYVIVGATGESEETLRETIDVLRRSRPNHVFVAPLSVLPGTELFERARREREWDESIWFEREDDLLLWDSRRRCERLDAHRRLCREFFNVGTNAPTREMLHPLSEEELREACERVPDALAVHFDLGQLLLKNGRHGEAAQALRQSLEIHPRFGKGWVDLGDCCLTLGQADDALTAWEKVESIEGEMPRNRTVALLRRAQVLLGRGQAEEALVLCRRAIEVTPEETEGHNLATQILLGLHRFDEAADLGQAWMKIAPDDPRALSVPAGCCFLQGELEDALLLFECAQRLDADNAEILTNLAVILIRLGRPSEAQRWLERCLASHPDNSKATKLLAACAA